MGFFKKKDKELNVKGEDIEGNDFDYDDENNEQSENEDDKKDANLKGGFFLKFFLVFFIILVVAIVVGIFYIQSLINPKLFTDELNRKFTDDLITTKTTISIKGQSEFKFFPLPHIILRDISIDSFVRGKFITSGGIGEIKVFPKLKEIMMTKNIIVEKVSFDKVDVIVNEMKEKLIETPIILKADDNITYTIVNSIVKITGLSYQREFDAINLNILFNKKKEYYFSGSMLSNKQTLNFDGDLKFTGDGEGFDYFEGKLKMESQAFKVNATITGKEDLSLFAIKSNADINTTQLFVKTIFNTNDFLYKKIIDNSALKIVLNLDYSNEVFSIRNLSIIGKNINGEIDGVINLKKDNKNYINIAFITLNLDILMDKNIAGNTEMQMSDIYLFNKEAYVFETKPEPLSNIEKILAENTTIFNVGMQELVLNDYRIKDFFTTFSFTNKIKFETLSLTLNNSHFFNIDAGQKFYFKGDNINVFLNQSKEKTPYFVSGFINLDNYNKILITNIKSKFNDITFKSDIEIQLDGSKGVKFLIVDVVFNNLNLQKISNFLKIDTKDKTMTSIALNMNNYFINSFYKFKIHNLTDKNGWFDRDYLFTIMTMNKYMSIYDIDFNKKIEGNVVFNTKNEMLKFDMNLSFNNYEHKGDIDFIEEIFNLPHFENWYGSVNIDIKNSKYKSSNLKNVNIKTNINNGNFIFENFDIEGFGGKCNLSDSFVDLKYQKKINFSFKNCLLKLEESLYLLTGMRNISGDFGLGVLLYSEGTDITNFKNNFLLKGTFIGNSIIIKNFGLQDVSEKLFKIKSDKKLLYEIKPLDLLFEYGKETIFEKISGSVLYQKKTNTSEFKIVVQYPLYNGSFAGNLEFFPSYLYIKMSSGFNLLAGDLKNLIPLTISINFDGETGTTFGYSTNLQQINDYIDNLKSITQK
ncbi:MAG: hypothetical protein LBT02_00310 [Rickettsiales bacterium]|jgi:hypothetical protein|nr:hypothetical protein [Rickettsiales bacterium]